LERQVQQQRTGKVGSPLPSSPVEVEKEVVVPQPPPLAAAEALLEGEDSDDLTVIRGIGARVQQLLNEGGIYTIRQLAGSVPDDVRRALGETARLANVEDWITQAEGLLE
jgi:predicted flap endonuclease-1-like 5' DNA nuclease